MSHLPSSSLVPVARSMVETAYRNMRIHTKAFCAQRREEKIVKLMQDYGDEDTFKSVFRQIIRWRVTREEAEKLVDAPPTYNKFFGTLQYRHGSWRAGAYLEDLADKLESACKLCQEQTIYLGLEDAQIVQVHVHWKPTT